jgi:formylglycine-generating enzyme required for sulfatase activity
MNRNSALTIAALGLFAVAAFNWAAISKIWAPPRELPGLEMADVAAGNYNLTILVPNVLERVYYSKPVKIEHPFQISRYEITIDQWNICFEDGACAHKAKQKRYQKGNHPVTLVSWFDAITFTNWLSNETGENYRLPTEEEWGYIAKSGKDFTKDTIEDLITNRQMSETTPRSKFRKTLKVGANGNNDWDISDTTGSVWEWTMTCWFSSDEANKRPWTIEQLRDPKLCPNRIVQGDERAHVPFFFGEVYTGGCGTGAPVDHIGFRIVKEMS